MARAPSREVAKYQTTLSGYAAWAVENHARLYGRSSADELRWIVEQWAEQNREALEALGISVHQFAKTREAGVIAISRRSGEGATG